MLVDPHQPVSFRASQFVDQPDEFCHYTDVQEKLRVCFSDFPKCVDYMSFSLATTVNQLKFLLDKLSGSEKNQPLFRTLHIQDQNIRALQTENEYLNKQLTLLRQEAKKSSPAKQQTSPCCHRTAYQPEAIALSESATQLLETPKHFIMTDEKLLEL